MINLTLIVLTYDEAIHIQRCLTSAHSLDARVVVVDSFSNDDTCNISKALGANIFQNNFVSQAQQFQWAMDNCDIETEWVIRLDADETIDSTLIANIANFIANDGNGHNGAVFHRKHIFLGRWVKHGGRYPLPMLRLFRHGTAHIEQRWMDEHIVLDKGTSTLLKGGFEDDNLNSVSWFIDKHNKYATREMVDIMLKRLKPEKDDSITSGTGLAIRVKRFLKQNIYMQLPYFLRPFLYFIYRYFFQFGFLDGASGFAYHFMQGFWYRALVDLKCMEIEKLMGNCKTIDEKISVLEVYSGYLLGKSK
jgi:glycosyltransferase involved in cell wall biosynthesis